MKFSGKMCLKIILKVTKNQGFTLSLEDTFFEKPPWVNSFKQLVGSQENVFLKCRKETNIVSFSYIIGCVYLNKNISDLWSL